MMRAHKAIWQGATAVLVGVFALGFLVPPLVMFVALGVVVIGGAAVIAGGDGDMYVLALGVTAVGVIGAALGGHVLWGIW